MPQMTAPPFITFEGCEGCGKSTQVKRLAARLQAAGVPLLLTREPGGTPLGEAIRELLLFTPKGAAISAEAEILLFAASRSQLVREVIEPARARGEWVISDRFHDSTTVYQGAARRLAGEAVARINAFAVGECVPDLTLVLDVDVQTARARMLRRVRPAGPADRMEEEPLAFHEEVRRGYHDLATQEPERVRLVDASAAPGDIEHEIWRQVTERFAVPAGAAGV